MLVLLGYTSWDQGQGQARQCYLQPADPKKIERAEMGSDLKYTILKENRMSAIPVLNVVIGAVNIYYAISGRGCSHNGSHVHQEDFETYRKYTLLKGIAELTLVGGWLLHGGATLYYYATRSEPQYDPV